MTLPIIQCYSYRTAGGIIAGGGGGGNTPGMITNVTGTVSTGSTLTITGSTSPGLVNEQRSSWDPFYTTSASGFEGANSTADGYPPGAGILSYDNTIKLMGSQSLKGTATGASDSGSHGQCEFQFPCIATQTGSQEWITFYRRWHVTGGWPHNVTSGFDDMKFIWMGNTDHYGFLNLQLDDGSSDGSVAPSNTMWSSDIMTGGDVLCHDIPIPSGAIVNDRWYLWELGFRQASAGSGYFVRIYCDNVKVFDDATYSSGARIATGGIKANAGNGRQLDVNWWDTTAGFNWQQNTDRLVVSTSRIGPAALIEISNNSTYAAGTLNYQPPTFISDTSVLVTCDLTGLGAGPYFLWVTNNNGTRSNTWAL